MVEPRAVPGAASARGGSHPVVPLARESLRQQDAAPEVNAPSGSDRSLHVLSTGTAALQLVPSSSIRVRCSDLPGSEAAQPQPDRVGAGDRLLPRPDAIRDRRARRCSRAGSSRSRPPGSSRWKTGRPVTSDSPTRNRPRRPASPIRVKVRRAASRRGVEQRERRPRADHVELPGRAVVVVPVPRLQVQAAGEGDGRVAAEQRDHELVGPLAQRRRRNGGGILVSARRLHRESAVETSRRRPDEEHRRIGRRRGPRRVP